MTKHNPFAHFILAAILFGLNTVIFKGGTWSSILGASLGAAGLVFGAGSGDFAAGAAQGQKLLGIVIAIIVNIIIYYALAAILIFIFNLFGKKK